MKIDPRQLDMFAAAPPPPPPVRAHRWPAVAIGESGAPTRPKLEASYSAASLAMQGKVTRPFRMKGGLWVVTGTTWSKGDADFECYQIVPAADFTGPGTAAPYHQHMFQHVHRDEWGGYHAMAAKHGKDDVVLIGPPVVVVCQDDA